MKRSLCPVLFCLGLITFGLCADAVGGCYESCCAGTKLAESEGVARVRVVKKEIVQTALGLRTHYDLEVEAVLHGELPEQLVVEQRGGRLPGRIEWASDAVELEVGGIYQVFLHRNRGSWRFTQAYAHPVLGSVAEADSEMLAALEGSKPLPEVGTRSQSVGSGGPPFGGLTATGFLERNGQPGRLTGGDSGQPIRVFYDASVLPAGITRAEALQALENGLNSWATACGLEFVLAGEVNFGQAASNISAGSDVINIQMHDSYGEISGSTLGIGGGSITFDLNNTPYGGTVNGYDFDRASSRYVVIESDGNDFNGQPTKFEEVLTHEIGHALGLAHSSENFVESDSRLSGAIMYYQVRVPYTGAALGTYDEEVIRFGYPEGLAVFVPNERNMDIVTRPSSWTPSSANQIQLAAFDKTGNPLVYSFPNGLGGNNGQFAWDEASLTVSYQANAYFGSTFATNSFYDSLTYVVSNGQSSASSKIYIANYWADDNNPNQSSSPYGDNPLAEDWLKQYFGTVEVEANPTDPRFLPGADPDGDGLTNLQEFQLATNPADPRGVPVAGLESGARWLDLEGVATDGYAQVDVSTDLNSWTPLAVANTNNAGTRIYLPVLEAQPQRYFRVRYVR